MLALIAGLWDMSFMLAHLEGGLIALCLLQQDVCFQQDNCHESLLPFERWVLVYPKPETRATPADAEDKHMPKSNLDTTLICPKPKMAIVRCLWPREMEVRT